MDIPKDIEARLIQATTELVAEQEFTPLEPGNVAVLDVDLAAQGNVTFMENSWRGDDFEPELRAAIESASNVGRFNWSPEMDAEYVAKKTAALPTVVDPRLIEVL